MILWFKNLPPKNIDFSNWNSFISNTWFRKNYMKFVYLLMVIIYILPTLLGSSFNLKIKNSFIDHTGNSYVSYLLFFIYTIFIISITFILHELLHIIVIYTKDDISLTHSGIFFWINTNAILSKTEFWLFMTLPIIILSLIPFIISFLINGYIKSFMLFICWINLMIASSDIINSILILVKPNNTIFCKGYYKQKPQQV